MNLTSSCLITAYEHYVKLPVRDNLLKFLTLAIEATEDVSHTLLEIRQGFPDHPVECTLMSNGSTGGERAYKYGPLFKVARGHIEPYIRFPRHPWHKRVVIRSRFPKNELPPFDGQHMYVDMSTSKVDGIINHVDNLLKLGPVVVYTFPRIVNWLASSEQFVQFCADCDGMVSITSSDSDAFYDDRPFRAAGIIVNDQMINWKSGLNFFTCDHGSRHSIRNLWASKGGRYFNLMNLSCSGIEIDDVITFGSCECGRPFAVDKFLPHYKYLPKVNGDILYDLGLAKLAGPFLGLQFITNGDRLEAHYISKKQLDFTAINNKIGAEVKPVPGSYFGIGEDSKHLNFWGRYDLARVANI